MAPFGGSAASLPLIITAEETKYAVSEPAKPAKDVDSTTEPTDYTLLSRFRNGEDDAATAIYLRYAKRLQLLARAQSGKDLTVRVDPEDIVQSVFRTFFRRAAKGHYTIPEGEELWKLFLVIALNKVRELGEHHRAAKRDVGHTTALDSIEDYIVGQQPLNEQAFGVLRMTIDEVLAELPEVQRRMAVMRIEGYGIDQIAETTRRAKRSVERVLQSFRSRLGAVLGQGED